MKRSIKPKIIKNNKTIKHKRKNGDLVFRDYPEFVPNLTPRQIFEMGSFGGTYWRPIYSSITKTNYKNIHKKYPFFNSISDDKLCQSNYNKKVNKYNCKVGTTLEFWEGKQWITKYNPYGWVHWYCDFFMGRRCPDDERQIKRWSSLTGPNGRFRKFLVTQITKKNGTWNDRTSSPKIRQVLQHWGYVLTESHYKSIIKERKK